MIKAADYSQSLLAVWEETPPQKREKVLRNFFLLLQKNRDLTLLPQIIKDLERRQRQLEEDKKVYFFSAAPLPEKISQQLRRVWQEKWGKDLSFQEEVRKELGGGLVVESKDFILDASVRRKIMVLKNYLKN